MRLFLKKTIKESVSVACDLSWKPYSRLFILDDVANWVLSWEARELKNIAEKLEIRIGPSLLAPMSKNQVVFYADQYSVMNPDNFKRDHRYGLAYFHGLPNRGISEFDEFYSAFKKVQKKICRLQVSNSEIYEFFMNEGWPQEKVHLIPIGVNLSFFDIQTMEKKAAFRQKFDIPQQAIALGSFQKDGEGWEEGNTPKYLKGPDVFLDVVKVLQTKIPELYVVLSGPARGYVKAGLEKLGVPYKHIFFNDYPDISELYQTLDAYIVSSRIEGGPKAVLESMATGIPLVTTKVGQAKDMVRHKENGWLADIDDVEGLADGVMWFLDHPTDTRSILKRARKTAEENSYEQQILLWEKFFRNFVEHTT